MQIFLYSVLCRSDIFDEKSFDEWVDLAEAPALPSSLRLYNELSKLKFKIFLLTGRSEFQRNKTAQNLEYAGYSNWERLLLRYLVYFTVCIVTPKNIFLDNSLPITLVLFIHFLK